MKDSKKEFLEMHNKVAAGKTGGNATMSKSQSDFLIMHKAATKSTEAARATQKFQEKQEVARLKKLQQVQQNRKEKARAATASGLLQEDADTLRADRDLWQSQLETRKKELEGTRPDAKTRQEEQKVLEAEIRKATAAGDTKKAGQLSIQRASMLADKTDAQVEELEKKIASADARLALFDRVDTFQTDRVNPLKEKEGFSTARSDFQNRNAELEEEIDNYTYDAADVNQRKKAEKDLDALDTGIYLDNYLSWYEGLNEENQQRVLDGRYNSQRNMGDSYISVDEGDMEAGEGRYKFTVHGASEDPMKERPDEGWKQHWERMTQDEINAYYYLANTEGMVAAKEFLDDLQFTLDRRHTLGREEAEREQMEESPTWANALRGVATVGANAVGGVTAFASDTVNAIKGEEFNPYSNGHYLQNISGTVRGAAAEDIQQTIAGDGSSAFWNGVGQVAANAYQAGLSSLDSIAGMYTMGSGYTVAMGMGAASSRMRELYESGATDEEIYRGAIGSGILEALFEKVSLDSLADQFIQANPEKWIKKALIQAGVEGSEEVFTEISNQILDAMNRGLNSDHNQRVRELMGNAENPMSREEAERQATLEDVMDVFWAGFGGVVSGGMSSIGGAVMDSNRANTVGQSILNQNLQEDILGEAGELRPGDKLTQKLQDKQNAGTLGKNEGIFRGVQDSRDATRLGRVYEQNVADMLKSDKTAVESAIVKRLKTLDETIRNPEATAEAVYKAVTGEDQGLMDKYYLFVNEKYANQVRQELMSLATDEAADNRWAKEIKTFSGAAQGFGTKETNYSKASREAMEKEVRESFGNYSDMVLDAYRPGQNRGDYVAQMLQMYHAGQDGTTLENAPETKTLTELQRQAAWDMGRGKTDYAYENNQGYATIKGETAPVNIVGVESAGNGSLVLQTDDGQTIPAENVTFGSYSQAKLYSVIAAMGVDTQTANQIVTMSQETGLDRNTFARAVQEAFYAGRSGVPFQDIPESNYAHKISAEERRVAWRAGRNAARERAVQKGKRIQQGKHGKAKGGVKLDASARSISKLNAQQQAGMNAANVLGALGLDITVYASTEEQRAKGMENGNIRLADGSIQIDLNAGDSGEGVMAWALSHEFTHFVEELSPEKFQSFQNILFAELGKNNQDVLEIIEAKVAELSGQQHYSELSEERLWEIATSEVVAEMMEPMLTDTDAISRISENLRQQDKSLWAKIKEWITGLVEKLKAAYKDLTPGSAIARQTREVVTQSETILEAWTDVATDAIVNYNLQDGKKNNTPGEVRLSERERSNAKSLVAQIQENIFQIDEIGSVTTITGNEISKDTRPTDAAMEFVKKFGGTVMREGFGEVRFSKGKVKSGLVGHGMGVAKLDTFAAIPDVIRKGIQIGFEENWKGRQKNSFVFAAPVTYKGKTAYVGVIVERDVQSNMYYVHEVVDSEGNVFAWSNKKEEPTSDRLLATKGSLDTVVGSSTSSIRIDSQNVNPEDTLFSSRNVQQTKNLVALHNITEDKFLKTLELGGFPMPSIAITKADIPHTNFGDITVVFGRETIDPKANRKNTVYSADAWTPTVPQVEYEADNKATSRVYKQLTGLRKQVDEYFQQDLSYAAYDVENALNRYGGEEGVVAAALDNYGVKAAYLEEQGQHITPKTKQETVGTPVSEEMQDRYVKIMDILGVDTPEQIGQLILKEVRDQHGAELEEVYPGITKSALRLGGLLNRMKAWLQGDNGVEVKTVTDVAATKEAVDSAIEQTQFEAWVRNLYKGVEKSSGVYNGKPRFTEAGNSRTFKQTHLPATLEGIVKAMAAQNNGNTKNVSGFNGVKTLRAGTAERFSSIAAMHQMEGRLQNLTQEQQDQIHDSLSNRLYNVIKAIDEEAGTNLGGSNSLIRYDTIGEILMEIAESGSYNVADIQRVFQQYGKSISDETAIDAKELLFDISQMPVNIFEAKPERAVGFNEIKTVLVPDTASQKLLQELDSRGIPYQTYQEGNDDQRHQMVQDMEDIRFSKRTTTQLERENEKLRQDKEYLKELVKLQRQGNRDLVPTRASVNHQAEALKKAVGARGNTAELAKLLDEFYRYMGKGNLDTVEMDNLAGKAADWLQEHQPQQKDPYAQEVLDWMKKRHVSLSQTQVDEIKYQYGSLREYQSAIKGSIIIDQKANTSLDQLWQEGSYQFADKFDSDVNEGDMPGAFADLVESLQNSESTSTAEMRYYQDENHRDLMNQVYDTYFGVEPVESIADELQKKIDKLVAEKNAAQEQYQKDISKAKSESKEENRATIKAMQELRKLTLESYRKQQSASDQRMKQMYEKQYRLVMEEYQKQLETMEGSEKTKAKVEGWRKTEARGQLQRTLNTLNKMMLNPTKTAYVPDSLQPAVIHAMEAMNDYRLNEKPDMEKIMRLRQELDELILDGSTKNQKRIRQINRELDKLQGDYGSVKDTLTELKRMYAELYSANEGKVAQIYDEGVEGFIADAMEIIGDTDYSDLSVQQLQALNDAYTAILHRIRTANNTFAYGKKESIDQLAHTTQGDLRRLQDRKKLTGEEVTALEKFGWNNLKPVYAFQRLGSATMATLYNNLRNGEDTFYRDIVDARAWAVAAMEKYGYGQWKDQVIEYESVDGKKFNLNLEERMSLYAYSRRRQAIEHLMEGGIVLSESSTRTVKNKLGLKQEKKVNDYNNYRLSMETIAAIGESLTQDQRGFAEEMQRYLSTVCADKNNEISRALYGVSIAKEQYYWPLKSSNLFSERVRNQQQNPGNRQKNAGHMKATVVHANNPVEVAGFMETWGNHVNNTAMYHAFTLPMEDFLRVYNFNNTSGAAEESIVQLITKKHGKAATEYIDQLLKDLNQGVRADPREGIAGALTSKFKKGAVSASLSVAIQQPSAVGRAFAIIDPKYFSLADLRYYVTSTVGQKAAEEKWEEVKKFAPVAGIKELGRFDVNMGRSTTDFITGAGESGFLAKVDEISGYLPEKMDQATWLMIWNAAERQTKAKTGLTGVEAKKQTAALFTEAITKTQVYDSVFSRSGNMRSKSLFMNMATSFMAEPTTTANMFMDAMADAKKKNWKSARRKVTSIATATVINALLASLVYASRDDDEDKPWKEKYLKSLTSELIDAANPLGYVPIAKDIWSLFQGYDVDRSDMAVWAEIADKLNKIRTAYEKLGSTDETDEEAMEEARKAVMEADWNAVAAVSNLFGIPVKNVLREIKAGITTANTVAEGRASDSTTKSYAMWEALMDNVPTILRDTDSRTEQLYKAVTSGSQVWVDRLKSGYASEEKFQNAVANALRSEDPRIRQAAQELTEGTSSGYKKILQEILSEGHFEQDVVEKAIQTEARKQGTLEGYSAKNVETFTDLYEDNLLNAQQYTQFLEYRDATGTDGKKLHHKDELIVYIGKMKVNSKAKDALYLQLGYDEDDLPSMPWHASGQTVWEARVSYSEFADYSDSAIEKFLEIRNEEITRTVFTNVYEYAKAKDAEGKNLHDKKAVWAYIDGLPLSNKSKDELHLAMGYKESTLSKAPWNK